MTILNYSSRCPCSRRSPAAALRIHRALPQVEVGSQCAVFRFAGRPQPDNFVFWLREPWTAISAICFCGACSPRTAIVDRRGDRRRLAPGSVVRHLQDYVSSLEPQFVIWCFQLTAFCVTAAAPLPKRSHAPRLARRGALPRASGPKRRQMPIRIIRHAVSRRRSGVSEGTMRRARKATASNEPVETRRMGR